MPVDVGRVLTRRMGLFKIEALAILRTFDNIRRVKTRPTLARIDTYGLINGPSLKSGSLGKLGSNSEVGSAPLSQKRALVQTFNVSDLSIHAQ